MPRNSLLRYELDIPQRMKTGTDPVRRFHTRRDNVCAVVMGQVNERPVLNRLNLSASLARLLGLG